MGVYLMPSGQRETARWVGTRQGLAIPGDSIAECCLLCFAGVPVVHLCQASVSGTMGLIRTGKGWQAGGTVRALQ